MRCGGAAAPCGPGVHQIAHEDVANGRGATWDSWTTQLLDLGELNHPRPHAQRWLPFQGTWGPEGVWIASLEIGTSPTGPGAKREWGNNHSGRAWRGYLDAVGGVALDPLD